MADLANARHIRKGIGGCQSAFAEASAFAKASAFAEASADRSAGPDLAVLRTEPVMAGLVPAIHAFIRRPKNVDARDKPGHDGGIGLRNGPISA
ncbi:hypothetical protein GWG65_33590 [Bradyrhizobium sp. CSA207]|uniref:hypothetical protein n=1 Tax=Bradyrhizobium sp. CSA207 TaxID=2698826 RepID=UPI0023AE7717|nr:hypothetical protein [Bradyrhizobium sp. CSA207]MDE5446244.1 hypothetical protein [Bradyrhizobium sp. CSA207]